MRNRGSYLSERALQVDGEGIRRALEDSKHLNSPINLSVGQPDFDVPLAIQDALNSSIRNGGNGYAPARGIPELNSILQRRFAQQYPKWKFEGNDAVNDTVVCSGVTAAIFFLLSAITNLGDEIIIPDPEFLHYAEIVILLGGVPVRVNTYPDFQVTSERVRPFISNRTKAIILSSPGNPTGTVLSRKTCADLVSLAEENNVLLIADEIYREFYFGTEDTCPSIADYSATVVVLRGLSKSHAMTGWRVGYAFGPREIISVIYRLQGLAIVSAPSLSQYAALVALDYSVTDVIKEYKLRSKIVEEELRARFQSVDTEGGFFYFVPVPSHLRLCGTEFCNLALEENVVLIPGKVFSSVDTHFRLSLTAPVPSLIEAIRRLNHIVDQEGERIRNA